MGLGHVLKNNRPDVVVSGINRGANLGQDLYYSGTVAAAREAAFHSVPAIAVSLVFNDLIHEHKYKTAATFIKWCLELDLHKTISPMTLININVPNLELSEIKGCKVTETGFRRYSEEVHARIDARGRDYYWIAGHYEGYATNANSDCHAVHEGFISISQHKLVDGIKCNPGPLMDVVEKLNAKFAR